MAAAVAVAEEVRDNPAELPPDDSGRTRREQLDAIFDAPWSEMTPWRPRWDTIGRAIMPDRPRWCTEAVTGAASTPPSYGGMMDNTATLAARTLSSGLATKGSNPATRWFGLTTTDADLDAQQDVERWLHGTEDRLFAAMDRSNYYAEREQVLLDAGVFAAGAMSIEPDRKTVIRCRAHPIGSYAIAEDERGRVNTFVRQWKSNAFNLVQEFGKENLPTEVNRALLARDRKAQFIVRHAIYPNEDYDAEASRFDNKRMAFRECYWLTVDQGRSFKPLADGFYAEWPVPCPRWGPRSGGGVWGSFAPGFIALPDVLMLYEMRLQYLNALRKQVTPPTVSGNAFRGKKIYSVPGANNVDDQSQGEPQLRALYEVNVPYQMIAAEMELVRQHIRAAFYADVMLPMLLRMSTQAEQPTALQAGLARDEQYGALGPVLDGFSDNLDDPSIDRIFGIMWRAGLIAPPPEKLRGRPLRVVQKSELAKAQQSFGVAALERHLQFTGAVASMWGANALDNTDPDTLIRKHGRMTGVDPEVFRLDQQRDAIRINRTRQAQQTAAVEAAPQLARAAKDAAQARQTAQAAGVN